MPLPDPDPTSLRICHPGGLALNGTLSVVLSEEDANNIGKLLDLAPAGTTNCAAQPDALLRFGFRDGTQADVELFTVTDGVDPDCNQPTASVAGHVWLLPPPLAEFLDLNSIESAVKGNAPPPDVTGLSLIEATDVTARAGLTIHADGRVTDPLLTANTVVLQDPPAGAGVIGSEVGVLLSQQPAPACDATQLEVDYSGVQYGTGDAFASLDIRDTGANPCTLTGPISVVGLSRAGQAVTNHEAYPVASELVLTAHTPRVGDGPTPNDVLIAWVPLQADVRDGPDANGLCTHHLVVPTTWLVTLMNGEKVVLNGDGSPDTSMSACEGQLMGRPQAPLQVTPRD